MYDPYDPNRFRNAHRKQRALDCLKLILTLAVIIIAVTIDGWLS